MNVDVRRFAPGTDLKNALDTWVRDAGWQAAVVVAAVGSLSRAQVRFAGRDAAAALEGPLELVALSGTLSAAGGSHLHVVVADADGRCFGGHLKDGAIVRTTAEIALGHLPALKFERTRDAATGYPELIVSRR